MLYLLGELDGGKQAAFERQLESSPELADELLRQSELLSGLGEWSSLATPPKTHHSAWRLIASVMAIAACIALVLLGIQANLSFDSRVAGSSVASLSTGSSGQAGPSEDLLIARAWADGHLERIQEQAELSNLVPEEILAVNNDDPEDMDSTLSWMFVGVSADINANPSEAAGDG